MRSQDEVHGSAGMIVKDPSIMGGRPCIKGTRIPVDIILACLTKDTIETVMKAYWISSEQVQACIDYKDEP